MTKDIYIIRNNINDKVYIGQARNTMARWAGHKSCAKCHGGFITIDKAMAQLGIENFTCEIIESQVENYNERERYWIAYYDCMIPNGYNYLKGGEGMAAGIENPCALIKDQAVLDAIITDLLFSEDSMVKIAEKYNFDKKLISAINRGVSYYQENISYPIRKRPSDFIDTLDIDKIYDDLLYSEKSQRAIAKENNTTTVLIREINKGVKFHCDNFIYPLRETKKYPKADKVKEMLKTTDYSLREIGRRCDVSYTMVAHINIGKYHFDVNEKYPIRQTNKLKSYNV